MHLRPHAGTAAARSGNAAVMFVTRTTVLLALLLLLLLLVIIPSVAVAVCSVSSPITRDGGSLGTAAGRIPDFGLGVEVEADDEIGSAVDVAGSGSGGMWTTAAAARHGPGNIGRERKRKRRSGIGTWRKGGKWEEDLPEGRDGFGEEVDCEEEKGDCES